MSLSWLSLQFTGNNPKLIAKELTRHTRLFTGSILNSFCTFCHTLFLPHKIHWKYMNDFTHIVCIRNLLKILVCSHFWELYFEMSELWGVQKVSFSTNTMNLLFRFPLIFGKEEKRSILGGRQWRLTWVLHILFFSWWSDRLLRGHKKVYSLALNNDKDCRWYNRQKNALNIWTIC